MVKRGVLGSGYGQIIALENLYFAVSAETQFAARKNLLKALLALAINMAVTQPPGATN